MPREIKFGEIPGIKEGHWFKDRREMMSSSFHRVWSSGIDGNGKDGTSAIVLSGGYEDDEDSGSEIIYTGAGGNDPSTKKQIEDQSWKKPGNAGLVKSMNEGLPVRVARGSKHNSKFSPSNGYTYAGLYNVTDAWFEKGKSGFKVCRFRLIYSGTDETLLPLDKVILNYEKRRIERRSGVVSRVIRDTKLSREVKALYNCKCQICGTTIKTKSGNYSEGAHIKPLGRPHNGDDSADNLLSLCPNHHVMLDKGSISFTNQLTLIGDEKGTLNLHHTHNLNLKNLKYHRMIHAYD